MRKIRVFSPDSYISLDYGRREGVIYRKSPKLTIDVVQQITEHPETLKDLRGSESIFGELLHQETIPLPDHDPLEKELQDFVKNRIAPYKYPRVIEFLDALPRTATGKLSRKALRQPDS